MVVKEKDGWYVKSKEGKDLGDPYQSEKQATDRLAQVEAFKHMKKGGR